MTRRLDLLLGRRSGAGLERYSFDDWADSVTYGGYQYSLVWPGRRVSGGEATEDDFVSMVERVHRRQGVVAAAVFVRALIMSQVRFTYRDVVTRKLVGHSSLRPLERPSLATARSSLLAQAEQHISYAGNAYFLRTPSASGAADRISLLSPEKVTVMLAADRDEWAELGANAPSVRPVAYDYWPDGRVGQGQHVRFGVQDVWHWSSLDRHPNAHYLGVSWVSSVLREINQDTGVSEYIDAFFDNGGTPSLLVGLPATFTKEQAEQFAEMTRRQYAGVGRSHQVMFVGAGSDVRPAGAMPQDLALKDLRGELESRVSARSRVPAVILGVPTTAISGGSALNAGNYSTTRRVWADTWFTPTAQNLCESLAGIVQPPNPTLELWYDARDILFLQEDQADAAEITAKQASAIRMLIDAGFAADAAVEAVSTHQLDALAGTHTGLTSVQLQPPAEGSEAAAATAVSGDSDGVRAAFELLERRVASQQRPMVVTPQVTVNMPERSVTVEPAEVRVDVASSPAPQVTVEVPVPEVTVNNEVPVPEVTVNNEVPVPEVKVDGPVVNVPAPQVTVEQPPQRQRRSRVRRDGDGRIAEIIDEP